MLRQTKEKIFRALEQGQGEEMRSQRLKVLPRNSGGHTGAHLLDEQAWSASKWCVRNAGSYREAGLCACKKLQEMILVASHQN